MIDSIARQNNSALDLNLRSLSCGCQAQDERWPISLILVRIDGWLAASKAGLSCFYLIAGSNPISRSKTHNLIITANLNFTEWRNVFHHSSISFTRLLIARAEDMDFDALTYEVSKVTLNTLMTPCAHQPSAGEISNLWVQLRKQHVHRLDWKARDLMMQVRYASA